MVFSSLSAICRLQAEFSCHAENQTRSKVFPRVEVEVEYFVATGILGLQHCAEIIQKDSHVDVVNRHLHRREG